ncbi:MAG: hypothetical protein CMN31_15520 [Sandaracinus sp.]|nr:hypothetical protein [Myxococcales bacterium]MAT28804.1 hypothetical protein [Sandaracinus sp.]MBJ72721.1 hypothetical protein [Sandaracinus sp.]
MPMRPIMTPRPRSRRLVARTAREPEPDGSTRTSGRRTADVELATRDAAVTVLFVAAPRR